MTSIEHQSTEHKRLSKEEATLIKQILSNQGFLTYLEMCNIHNNYYNVVVYGIERRDDTPMDPIEPKDDTKSIKDEDQIKTVFNMQFPSGEAYLFDRQAEPDDLKHISEIWEKVRKDEILRIEQDAKTEILIYLQDKGYKLIYQEKIRFT